VPDPESIINPIKRTLHNLVIATVVIYIGLLLVGGFTLRESVNTSNESETTHTSLCTLRADLKTRVATSEELLRSNPAGIPGITAKAIKESLAGQLRTIKALSVLECD